MAAAHPRSPARLLASGERFAGKYVLGRRIAVGGMGEIWVARNQMTSAEVALKVLRGDLDRKLEVEARFRHEGQVGAMLAHRNIVRVFDLLVEPDGTLVLVMELLRGETLRHFLKHSGPISATQAIAIMCPVLSALQHSHEMGIIHRDLKPANLLLAVDPDGHVTPKLLDFGIAKVADSGIKTMFGRVLGTPRYMSPEQIRADPKIDGRSDVFSAATLLVEMMTGSSPFEASSPSASLAAVLETQVDPDPRIDPRLWLVMNRALSKRPYERYATANEFAAALRQALAIPDADLQATLQRNKPPIERHPSFSDVSPTFEGSGDSDDEDDEDDIPKSLGPDPHASAGATSGNRIATGDREAPPRTSLAPGEAGPATGAMSVPLRTPNRRTRIVVMAAVGGALLLALAAGLTRFQSGRADPAKPIAARPVNSAVETPSASAAPITIEFPDDLPAPGPSAATTSAKPTTKPHASPPTSKPITKPATKPPGKKVATTPDF